MIRLCATNVALVAGFAMGLAVLEPVFLPGAALALALAFALAFGVFLAFRRTGLRGFPHDRIGACNGVTYLRASIGCLMSIPLAAPDAFSLPWVGWAIFAAGSVALSLDGIDGWLARRQGTSSAFGARFDMEVDAALALLLALLALHSGAAGPAVLVLGLARYLFLLAALFWPVLRGHLPDRFSRKAVCVIQLGVLIGLQAPFIPPWLGAVAVPIGAALLVWSFLRDVAWLAAAGIETR